MPDHPTAYPLLSAIESPADLRALPESELPSLAAELREFLIQTVSPRGAHFAAGLGAVELAIALHYVFDTPEDRLVWDVGHQAYPHKVLSGRRDRLDTIQQRAGLAPFPSRSESLDDASGAGHSSTSIGAALGMAIAAARQGTGRRAVAVISDGAMSAGMAFEALNHAGSLPVDLLVVLNDSDMSSSKHVGALSNYLARVISGRFYGQLREGGKRALRQLPVMRALVRRSEEHFKGMVLPGTLFMEMGFNYVGPIDGHDIKGLLRALSNLRAAQGAQLLHLVTRKGKGYSLPEAEALPAGGMHEEAAATPSYSQVFDQWLCDMAEGDSRIMAITPAMREGSGLVQFSRRFPERYFDVAIAEQHAVTFAAGLAAEGLRPVVAICSTSLQRGYDQLIHDVALQKLPVLFAVDRAGFVGSDGATHHGCYDLSFLRCIPNMVVMAPADEDECRQMLYTATGIDGPAAVRYPRGAGPGVPIVKELSAVGIGRAQVRRHGESGLALLSFGVMLAPALRLGERFDATVVNMRFVKPLDLDMLRQIAASHAAVVTLEDNAIAGGAGCACAEALDAEGLRMPRLHLGIPDRIAEYGAREECMAAAGLDAAGMAATIEQWLAGVPALKSDRSGAKLAAAGSP